MIEDGVWALVVFVIAISAYIAGTKATTGRLIRTIQEAAERAIRFVGNNPDMDERCKVYWNTRVNVLHCIANKLQKGYVDDDETYSIPVGNDNDGS